MKKLFYVMLVAVATTIGFAACGPELDDAALKAEITGQVYEGTYNDAIMRIATMTGYTYTITVAANPISAGSYDVVNAQMVMTDMSDATIFRANILNRGKTLELIGETTTVTLTQVK